MSDITLIIVIVVAVVVIVAIVVLGYQMARQRRTKHLREQYGPEYDRAVALADSQHAAESELRGRSKRHGHLKLRSLASSERENFERGWSDIQGQFVDDPSAAVRNADLLVVEVMSAHGYPIDGLAELLRRQRTELGRGLDSDQTTTEDLRQALIRYRSFFDRLLSL